jgi:hypothetical protein
MKNIFTKLVDIGEIKPIKINMEGTLYSNDDHEIETSNEYTIFFSIYATRESNDVEGTTGEWLIEYTKPNIIVLIYSVWDKDAEQVFNFNKAMVNEQITKAIYL